VESRGERKDAASFYKGKLVLSVIPNQSRR
jgi:hypothetical protein